MSFKKNNYIVIKQAVSKELISFLFDYISLKKDVVQKLYQAKYTTPNLYILGHWNDAQVPNTYCHYSDIAFETLLKKLKPIVEKETNKKLNESYSYFRFYKKNDKLKKHIDRKECELSTTLNLGGDTWPIYLENKKIILKAGDMLIYKGNLLEHWRNKFTGKECAQVFLHYVSSKLKFDARESLGVPPKNKENKYRGVF
jgi:hypothetical protein